ncbi:MAG: hypothetical protein AAF515_15600 [Pseudomonadota bacterium]
MPTRLQQRSAHMAWMTLALLALLIVSLIGCGGSTPSLPPADSPADPPANPPANPPAAPPFSGEDARYAGPGSHWEIELGSDGEFQISFQPTLDGEVAMTVGGDYQRTAAGFINMTVAEADGEGAPEPGDTAWGLEAPGLAFFLQPTDADGFISMVTAGDCPNEVMNSIWNTVRGRSELDASDADADLFGGFTFDPASGNAVVSHRFALDAEFTDQGPSAIGTGTCEQGLMRVPDANIYLTDNGGAIVHVQPDEDDGSIIFALPSEPIDAVADIDGAYAGIAFSGSEELAEAPTRAFTAQCDAGSCAAELMDVASGETSGETFGVELTGTLNLPLPGQLTGTLVDGADSTPLACNVLVRDATVLSCVGRAPDDPSQLLNLLLVEQQP